jgi:hypothetical protein
VTNCFDRFDRFDPIVQLPYSSTWLLYLHLCIVASLRRCRAATRFVPDSP